MPLLRLLILSSQHRSNSAAICERGMSQVKYWVIQPLPRINGIEYDGAVKYVARAIYLCISLVMEVERGRFYLIGLYLIVYWDVVCCFE